MRAALIVSAVVAVGCSACKHPAAKPVPVKPLPPPIDAPPPTTTIAPPPVAHPIVKPGDAKRAMIEAPHAGPIRAFAATPDGTAAITADDTDGLRLWPALDGSLEPRIVDLPRPKLMALGKDGAGFVAAIVDDVGGLVIAQLDAEGRTLQRASIEPELAFVGIAMTPRGPLGWRNDQTLVQFDRNGATLGVLPGQPGERIGSIVIAGERAIAVVETAVDQATHRQARSLDVAKLAWGSGIDLGTDLGIVVALSASGKRLATFVQDAKTGVHLVVFDVASKKLVANLQNRAALGLGFVDDDHLALVSQNAFEWVEIKAGGTVDASVATDPFVPQLKWPFAIAGGHLITPRNDELAIATPAETKFLGYGLESPNVAAAGNGRLLVGLGDQFALLDRDLKQVASLDAVMPKGANIQEVHWLGGDEWLVEGTNANDGKTAISLIDLATKTRKELKSNLPVAPIVMFEPTTNIVTLSLGDAPEALKYDPAKKTLERLLVLPKPNGFEQRELAPVAPSLAHGTQLVSVQMRDATTLRWSSSATAETGPSATIDGTLAAIDRAGHVFVWQNGADKKLVLTGYDNGKAFGTIATEGPTTVWPDGEGKRLLAISGRSIALLGLDGAKAWSAPVAAATEAHWLDGATIALVTAVGLARLDAKTGEIAATRCGWRFGLTTQPHPFMVRGESMCRLPN